MQAEKNCGDMHGDIGFYLANHNMGYLCTVFPNGSDCSDSNAIEKGSQNNIFVEFEVEVDGQFGPYVRLRPPYDLGGGTARRLDYLL